MDKEQSVINCVQCGETKIRYLAGKYPDNKNKKWVDENGLEWSGHTCSICHREKSANRKRLKKLNKNSYIP